MKNHIEEYFAQTEGTKESINSRELFNAKDENIDLKTELTNEEIALINVLFFNNSLLIKKGLNPIYTQFINRYLRLKVSKDRQSRKEFVDVNKGFQKPEEMLNNMSNMRNILDVRK